MGTVGIATGAGRGMGLACASRMAGLVDTLLLVDLDEEALQQACADLSGQGHASVEPYQLDVTDGAALDRLAARVSQAGVLRAVSHAAGISPTMAGWERIFTVDLVGTAMLTEALRPLFTAGTAMVCFASMAAVLAVTGAAPEVDAALDEPLHEHFLQRIRDAVGPSLEDPGVAYSWAKRGVQRLAQREAVVAFLLSDEATFVTGVDVLVDGGVCAAVRGAAGAP